MYSGFECPRWLKQYDRAVWSRQIDLLKLSVNRDASPGVPYLQTYATNGILLDSLGTGFNNIVLDRIENILELQGEFTNIDLINQNCADPVRLFVKQEPHKIEKIKAGRFRLIMSVSIVDKMIQMLLHAPLNKYEIANWTTIPSKPGMGFTTTMITSLFNEADYQQLSTLASADVSGWDWSVTPWLREIDIKMRLALTLNHTTFYHDLVRRVERVQMECVYQTSDGHLLDLDFRGNINSGSFNTSSSNSHMRTFLSCMIQIEAGCTNPFAFSMGDDCIERFSANAQDRYTAYGFDCKMYNALGNTNEFEFCSHIFRRTNGRVIAYSLNHAKEMMRLLHQSPSNILEWRMLMASFQDDLQDSPVYKQIVEVLLLVGWYEKYYDSNVHNAPPSKIQ